MVTRSDSKYNNELGSNPSKGIFVLVLFLINAIMCKILLFLMETTRKRKSDLQKKGPSRPSIF